MTRLDVLLADHAQVEGGKLFVAGGGISNVTFTEPVPDGEPYVVSFAITGVVEFDYDARGEHTVGFEVVDEDGHPPLWGPDGGRHPLAGELRIAFDPGSTPVPGLNPSLPFVFPLQVPFARPGRYQVTVSVDGVPTEPRVYTVIAPTPPPQVGGGSGPTSFRL